MSSGDSVVLYDMTQQSKTASGLVKNSIARSMTPREALFSRKLEAGRPRNNCFYKFNQLDRSCSYHVSIVTNLTPCVPCTITRAVPVWSARSTTKKYIHSRDAPLQRVHILDLSCCLFFNTRLAIQTLLGRWRHKTHISWHIVQTN